jgi:hypothetical protein
MTDAEKDKRWEDFLKTRDEYLARHSLTLPEPRKKSRYNPNLTDAEKTEISNRVIGHIQTLLDKLAKSRGI